MNTLFMTQGSGLEMFYDVMQAMNESSKLNRVGFYVTDSRFYNKFVQKNSQFESESFYLLKEWEIVRDSRDIKPDTELLEAYEKEIGRPFLWNAIVADRRIYFGRKYAYAQDYTPRYKHEQMLAILQVGLKRMESLFDTMRPDCVILFQCITIGEYLSYLFACARDIPILNLRPTRIRNYIYAGESVLEPSEQLRRKYEKLSKHGIKSSLKSEAINFLNEVRSTHAKYEGVVPVSNKPPVTANSRRKRWNLSQIKRLVEQLKEEYRYRFGQFQYDNHFSGYIGPYVARKVVRPFRARVMEKKFSRLYVKPDELPNLNYAFFPLHTEPEVTMLVYSKTCLNQIEVARLISHNLPVGMKLVVKEHPWAVGKRPISYYKKLLEIPNILLADSSLKSRDLVSDARIITVIAGSIGFEGLMLKKPVIVLGKAPYNFLPSSMIRHVDKPGQLGDDIRDILENYEYNEKALLSYISAIINESVPVDLYTMFLGRKGVYRPEDKGDSQQDHKDERKNQIELLARYLVCRYLKVKKQTIMS